MKYEPNNISQRPRPGQRVTSQDGTDRGYRVPTRTHLSRTSGRHQFVRRIGMKLRAGWRWRWRWCWWVLELMDAPLLVCPSLPPSLSAHFSHAILFGASQCLLLLLSLLPPHMSLGNLTLRNNACREYLAIVLGSFSHWISYENKHWEDKKLPRQWRHASLIIWG